MSPPQPLPPARPVPRPALRVAVVTETYPPEVNGVAVTLRELVGSLLDRGHQVQLVRPRQGRADLAGRRGALETVLRPGVTIPFYRSLRMGLPSQGVLERLWRQVRPDVAYVATEGPLGWSAVRAARVVGVPTVSGFHTNFHQYSDHYGLSLLHQPIAAYLRRFHNATAATLVATEELGRHLQDAGFQNLRPMPRGVDTRLFDPRRRDPALRRAWGAGDGDLVAAYVGRLAAEKNLRLGVAAWQAMREVAPGTRFVLVGDGPLREELAAAHPELVLCGVRTGEDLAAHYASADLFLFPSTTETFGNVLLEAMASGLAAVSFDYACGRLHLRRDDNGVPVPLGDEAAFLAAARTLAGDPGTVARLGRAARHTAVGLDWREAHGRYEEVLLEYAATRHSPGPFPAPPDSRQEAGDGSHRR